MLKHHVKVFEVKNAQVTLKLPREKAKSNCSLGDFTNYKSSHAGVL